MHKPVTRPIITGQLITNNCLADKIQSTRSKTVKVVFDYLPQEDHATIMHQAVSNAFRLIYPTTGKQ